MTQILYFAVYKNREYYSAKSFDEVTKDKLAWFYVKRECIVSYSYGEHYKFTILDVDGKPASFIVGNFEILNFSTGGDRRHFNLTINFTDITTRYLYTHNIDRWNDEIKTVIEFIDMVNNCGGYQSYVIMEENKVLKREINNLRKLLNK